MEKREILLYLSLKYSGDWNQIYSHISNKEPLDEAEANTILKDVHSNYITLLDDNYPECLKQLETPPFVIYYHGDISLLNAEHKLGVVGSREVSDYGKLETIRFVKQLCKDFIIISGMAYGIDTLAHTVTIENGGRTIAVLGCGINICYPPSSSAVYENCKKENLVISEYPDKTQPNPKQFPIRNRIIAALSDQLLVTEGKINSGTQITAHLMADKNADVYCVPTRNGEMSICNHLIAQGAVLVENPNDVYVESGVRPKSNVFEK